MISETQKITFIGSTTYKAGHNSNIKNKVNMLTRRNISWSLLEEQGSKYIIRSNGFGLKSLQPTHYP